MSDRLSGKRVWATAQYSSCKFPQAEQEAHETIYQQRKAEIPAIRRAWLETPDQGLNFGLTGIKDANSTIASFFWTDSNTVNHKVCRETIPYSGNTKKELNATPIAKRVEKLVTEAMNADPAMRSPPMDLITYIMADSLLKTTPYTKNKPRLDVYFESQAYKIRREKGIFLDAYTEAIDILRAEKRDWEAVRKELQTCSPIVTKAMANIKNEWRPKAGFSAFEQYDRDQKALKDDDILCPVPDDIIYLLVDRRNKVLVFRWPKGLEWVFGKDFNNMAMASLQAYIAHEPPFGVDRTHHVMHEQWLRDHPEFDHTKTEGAACGIYHFGITREQGRRLMAKRDSAGKAWNTRENNEGAREILRLRKELMTQGFMPAITRAHMFVQEVLDPKLLKKQQEVMASMASFLDKGILTVPDDPYSLKAVLVDVSIANHVDVGDWIGGYAIMSTSGHYRGGDLGLRLKGRKLGYAPGDIIAIKGREDSRTTADWTGQHRMSVVTVCQTLPRVVHLAAQQAQGAAITDPEELQILEAIGKRKVRKAVTRKDAKEETLRDAQESQGSEEVDEGEAEFELTNAQVRSGVEYGEQEEQGTASFAPYAAQSSSLECHTKQSREESSVTHQKARATEWIDLEDDEEEEDSEKARATEWLSLEDDEDEEDSKITRATEWLELEEVGDEIVSVWVLDG